MGSLLRAEWRKMTGNRWLLGCLVGIFPLLALFFILLLLSLTLLNENLRSQFAENPTPWTEASLLFWAVPNSIFGRLIIVGLAAFMFGGEYQWGTWKNILPRRGRVSLVLMKFLTLGILMLSAFALTSLIWVLGRGLIQVAIGSSYPPNITEIPGNYWERLLIQLLTAFLSTLIIAAIAALVALLTRSILASVIVGLGAVLMDGVYGAGLVLLYGVTKLRFFPQLYRFSISYNVDNLLNIANNGEASPVLGGLNTLEGNPTFQRFIIDPPLSGSPLWLSLLLLLIWAGLLVTLCTYAFYRQDIRT